MSWSEALIALIIIVNAVMWSMWLLARVFRHSGTRTMAADKRET